MNIFFIFFGIGASLFLLELVLRRYGLQPRQERLTVYEFDDELGWRNRKQAKQLRMIPQNHGFDFYFIYTDANGFPADKQRRYTVLDHKRPSIMLIGDSFVAGEYLPYKKNFAYLLAAMLPKFQVINTGVPGYAPDQYLMVSRRHLAHYNVKTAIVVFFPFNDIADLYRDNLFGYQRPVFGESFDRPTNLPLVRTYGKDRKRNYIQKIADNSAIYTLLRPLIKSSNRRYNREFWVTSIKDIIYDRTGMERALSFIGKIKKENPAVDLMIYYMPHCEELLHRDIFKKNIDLFKEIADGMGLAHITPDSFSCLSDPRIAYNIADGHLSAFGAELVAQEIYAKVKREFNVE